MRSVILGLCLACGPAAAEAPLIDAAPLCRDGVLIGIVVQVQKPGIYPIRWPLDICWVGPGHKAGSGGDIKTYTLKA